MGRRPQLTKTEQATLLYLEAIEKNTGRMVRLEDLAVMLNRSKATASRRIQELVDKKYVERKTRNTLEITEMGRTYLGHYWLTQQAAPVIPATYMSA